MRQTGSRSTICICIWQKRIRQIHYCLVCENLDEDVSYAFVNLRKARTVFGCANLILAELGQPSLKSAQGINIAIEEISNTIEQALRKKKNNTKLFILVLEEFDVLLYDMISLANHLILFTNY